VRVLALPAPAADLCHVIAIAADGVASLLPRFAGFRGRELVRRSLLVSRPSTRRGDLPLSLVAHPGETPAIAGGTP
jgi:hypothetical protein